MTEIQINWENITEKKLLKLLNESPNLIYDTLYIENVSVGTNFHRAVAYITDIKLFKTLLDFTNKYYWNGDIHFVKSEYDGSTPFYWCTINKSLECIKFYYKYLLSDIKYLSIFDIEDSDTTIPLYNLWEWGDVDHIIMYIKYYMKYYPNKFLLTLSENNDIIVNKNQFFTSMSILLFYHESAVRYNKPTKKYIKKNITKIVNIILEHYNSKQFLNVLSDLLDTLEIGVPDEYFYETDELDEINKLFRPYININNSIKDPKSCI